MLLLGDRDRVLIKRRRSKTPGGQVLGLACSCTLALFRRMGREAGIDKLVNGGGVGTGIACEFSVPEAISNVGVASRATSTRRITSGSECTGRRAASNVSGTGDASTWGIVA